MVENSGKAQSRFRSILTQVGSFALAIVLMYLALRGVDLGDLWTRIRSASFGWLLPLTIVVFTSHWIRAWRWRLLLEALPPGEKTRRVSLTKLFGALMAGYMVNYAAPRLGELVRTSIVARLSSHKFASILGTVVAERMLDVLSLGIALLSVLMLLQDRLELIWSNFQLPGFLSGSNLLIAFGVLIAGGIALAVFLRRVGKASKNGRLKRLLSSFSDGLQTLIKSGRTGSILLSTVAMWVCYLYMAYIPLKMLGMTTAFDLGLVDAWSLMNIGALGVVVPAPGGTGTYHYITQLSLTSLWSVPADAAAAYAIMTHAIQMLLYVTAGFVSLVGLGMGVGSILSSGRSAKQ